VALTHCAQAELRNDMLNYQAYLKQRRDEEKQLERELEQLCQEETDRANGQRDKQWAKESFAR
jgi:hypothetical protein